MVDVDTNMVNHVSALFTASVYRKFASNSYIYTKLYKNCTKLYKAQTKSFKLEMYMFCTFKHCASYTKPITTTILLEWCLYVFCMYTGCTNCTKYIQMVMNHICSCWFMFLCVYKNPAFFTFWIFASTMTPSSLLLCNFVKFQDQSFYIQKAIKMNLYIRFFQY